MIHYSCDRCKRILDPTQELRYVVRIEAQAEMESMELDERDDDRDHLSEISDILERLDDQDDDGDDADDDVYRKLCFDLCPECYRQYLKNPLGRELTTQLGFSAN